MRRLAYMLLALTSLATLAASAWAWAQNPLAAPLVARSEAAAEAALTRALAFRVTPAWMIPRMEAALAAGDADEATLLLRLAADHPGSLPEPLRVQAEALIAHQAALPARAADCARCAYDIAACERLSQIAACALPVELSPLGDVNALRRQGAAWVTGGEVDGLETGLALAGLGATALTLHTGGTAYAVKAGASVLRAARRMGTLGAGLTAELRRLTDLPVRWEAVPDLIAGRAGLDAVTDTAKLAALGRLAGDLGEVRAATSTAETIALLRHVDSAGDAAALARVARIEGAATPATMRALGKARAFRALVRLSDLALAALGLAAALALQLLALLSESVRLMLRPRSRPVA